MHRVIVLGILVVGLARMSHPATAEGQAHREPLKVDTTGVTATIKYEAVLESFLTDLNGKYKLRVTEITIAPGGHVGDHHHLGPGIRQMTAGTMQYILPDRTRSAEPCTHVLFEIVPVEVDRPSLIPPQTARKP